MFAYCGNNPIDRKDATGMAYVFLGEYMAEVDPDGPFDEAAIGSGGWGLGVNTSYYTAQSVQSYDWSWQNSVYNQNTTSFTDISACFVAGTLVQIAGGTKPIEEIETGDYVWAWNEETGDVALKQVVETYVNETTELIHIFVSGEEIITTPTHPFYSPVKGWTDAAQLRAGDILVLVNGKYVVVENVQHEFLEVPIKVYNFQVKEYHTYYVSNAGVLVHNDCKQQMVAGSKDGYNAKVSVGGEAKHPNSPHAHIFWKHEKRASVDEEGNVMIGSLDKRGMKFVWSNLEAIAKGIAKWWFYGK